MCQSMELPRNLRICGESGIGEKLKFACTPRVQLRNVTGIITIRSSGKVLQCYFYCAVNAQLPKKRTGRETGNITLIIIKGITP